MQKNGGEGMNAFAQMESIGEIEKKQ